MAAGARGNTTAVATVEAATVVPMLKLLNTPQLQSFKLMQLPQQLSLLPLQCSLLPMVPLVALLLLPLPQLTPSQLTPLLQQPLLTLIAMNAVQPADSTAVETSPME